MGLWRNPVQMKISKTTLTFIWIKDRAVTLLKSKLTWKVVFISQWTHDYYWFQQTTSGSSRIDEQNVRMDNKRKYKHRTFKLNLILIPTDDWSRVNLCLAKSIDIPTDRRKKYDGDPKKLVRVMYLFCYQCNLPGLYNWGGVSVWLVTDVVWMGYPWYPGWYRDIKGDGLRLMSLIKTLIIPDIMKLTNSITSTDQPNQ